MVLVASFLMAIGWSILCDLETIAQPGHHTHNEATKHGSDHHHGDNHHGDHQNEGETDDNCCEDLADNLFSAITDHSPLLYSFDNTFFVQSFNNPNYLIRTIHPRIKRIVILNDLPPPKIIDIRIFIQSFLN